VARSCGHYNEIFMPYNMPGTSLEVEQELASQGLISIELVNPSGGEIPDLPSSLLEPMVGTHLPGYTKT
jgi:hypothetical protein